MKRKRNFIILLISATGIIAAFVFFGYYPVAFVGIKPIFAGDYNKNFLTSLNYYEKALKIYANDSQALKADEAKIEIKRAVLDNLIENILIEKELKKEIKQGDLDALIEKKINEIPKDRITDEAIESLYRFSFGEFRKRVLEPQAKKEILENRMFLAEIDFNEKMKNARAQAKVAVFLTGFEWNGKEVIIK